jgi:hypothetical protein
MLLIESESHNILCRWGKAAGREGGFFGAYFLFLCLSRIGLRTLSPNKKAPNQDSDFDFTQKDKRFQDHEMLMGRSSITDTIYAQNNTAYAAATLRAPLIALIRRRIISYFRMVCCRRTHKNHTTPKIPTDANPIFNTAPT